MFRHAIKTSADYLAEFQADTQIQYSLKDSINHEAYYMLSQHQSDTIFEQAQFVYDQVISALEYIITGNMLSHQLGYPEPLEPVITASWYQELPSWVTRLNFIYDGYQKPQLLSVSGDSYSDFLEAGLLQLRWLEENFPDERYLQGNDLLDATIFLMSEVADNLKQLYFGLDFQSSSLIQHKLRASYNCLYHVAQEAGLAVNLFDINGLQCEYSVSDSSFEWITKTGQVIPAMFLGTPHFQAVTGLLGQKLVQEFQLRSENIPIFEPLWQGVMSNRRLLKLVYDSHPNSENFLPMSEQPMEDEYYRKPIHGYGYQNISHHIGSSILAQTEGIWGEDEFICQAARHLPHFDGWSYITSVWVINGIVRGFSIHEGQSPITDNTWRLIPHVVTEDGNIIMD